MFDKEKAEAILKFLNTAKWEHGVRDSVALVQSYKWLVDFFEKYDKPKEMGEPKKSVRNGTK